ncbi:hypothetical protein LOD99_15700 [Oopsacas minuta]|uniref:Ubiquitin-like domain-containing protein n=1 Tax=Oopsacas minuta TaxID=111878 RepID=A0AAV7KBI7_9METZ|nr:hypothetical protein LOD99_15700 [Oopsacas minuta]
MAALEMPVRALTLYNNGYGVFQRDVKVKGRGHIDLYFQAKDMEYVLKSLSFTDETGSSLGNISYEPSRPEATFSVDESESIIGLMRSLQGFTVSVKLTTGNEVQGRLLGVDTLETPVGDRIQSVNHICLLLPDGSLIKHSINSIDKLRVLDTSAVKDIEHSLDLIMSAEKTNMQKLSIFYHGDDQDKILSVRYGVIVSEWQSSYRLVLKPEATASDTIRFRLEGFAVVNNVKDDDWNDIKLTLVVGAPMLPTTGGSSSGGSAGGTLELTIKQITGADIFIRANPRDTVEHVIKKIATKKGISESSCKLIFAGKQIEPGRTLTDYNIQNNATIHLVLKTGASQSSSSTSGGGFVMAAQHNLSYYPIDPAVTAKRKQKAIVPLLSTELQGHQVLLYDENIRKGNPLTSILFENATGRTLDGGSIQVMTEDLFLGEGSFLTLHPGDESSPIPYCVETGCEVTVDYDISTLKFHRVTIKNGLVEFTRKRRQRTIYRINNKTDRSLDFMLNHPFLDGWELLQKDPNNPQNEIEEPVDITDRLYQFRFPVGPRVEKKVFNVRESTNDVIENDIDSQVCRDDLENWTKKAYLDQPTIQALTEVLDLQSEVNEIAKAIVEKEGDIRELNTTQSRLRDNIKALQGHEGESKKYVKQLGATEDRLTQIQSSIKGFRQDKKKIQIEKDRKIDLIEFSKDLKVLEDESESTV